MKKTFLTREVKIGIMTITAILLLYYGINFLKGINIFSSSNTYYATYEKLDGLVPSCPVMIKGFKVGQVDKVQYDFSKQKSFIVKISVSKDIRLPQGTRVQLYDDGLMGGKAMELLYPTITPISTYQSGDTLPSQIGIGIIQQIAGGLVPKIENISSQTDSLIRAVRMLVENKHLYQSLAAMQQTTANLSETSLQFKQLVRNDIPPILHHAQSFTGDLQQITGNLKKIDYAGTFARIDNTVSNLSTISSKINSAEGTLGMLINDKDLYVNLSNTASSANSFLVDLQKNPKRYVHFSLFGKKAK